MIKSYKVKLELNNKQKTILANNANVARFIYNLTLEMQQTNYKNGGKFLSDKDIRKQITKLKQDPEALAWLYQYDCDIVKQAVKDACNAYKKFFNLKKGFPKFKSKKHTKPSFYIDCMKLKISNGYIKIPKCNKIKLYEKNYIPENLKLYSNPRITSDGISWHLSVGVEQDIPKTQLTNEVIGIDLGLEKLATCSNGMIFDNISKNKNYQKLSNAIKRQQKKVARRYRMNKVGKKFIKTSNIRKLERQMLKKRIRLNNIKKDYFHKSSTEIVRAKPSQIVLEDLNIAGMRKNKHLSHTFQETSISMFKDMLVNKANFYGIEIIYADRFYPSSQLCSNCGHRKVDLKLSDRIYKCSNCGLEINRDYNASINLKHYPKSIGEVKPLEIQASKVVSMN